MTFLYDQIARESDLAIAWRQQLILEWAYASAFQLESVEQDGNGAIVTANIVWPDGATGVLTTDVASTDWPGAIDAWHATYASGNTLMYTVTQPQITRGATGTITAQPPITIA